MKIILFLIQLIVGAIGISTWIFGCCMMFYVVWSLNTITNIQSFSIGDSLITNGQLIFGIILSTVGLLIIYSSWKKNLHTLRLCIFLTVLSISMEIGTFISLKVANVSISNIVDQGWKEMNNQSKNFIQKELKCCGLTGLSEFASKLDPIDQSCYYQRQMETDSKYKFSSSSLSSYEPYRTGCKQKLIDWLRKQRKIFIISTCLLLAIQILSIILMLILLKLLQKQNEQLEHEQRFKRQSNIMMIIDDENESPSSPSSTSTTPSSLIFGNKQQKILLQDI
ncbi:uncharacterized protein LOC124498697 [Dermatophagoides farinae]|uniref:uncharacterized protein LOC124498697 n=1 Tax=Dermatophagoides farinae TaxID=6954 RepID=UPI003F610C4A